MVVAHAEAVDAAAEQTELHAEFDEWAGIVICQRLERGGGLIPTPFIPTCGGAEVPVRTQIGATVAG